MTTVNFLTNEYKCPASIEQCCVTYVLNHTLLIIGSLSFDVICGAKNLAQIWFDETGHACIERIDRGEIVPIGCTVNWDFGSVMILWSDQQIPDHEIIASYEYEVFPDPKTYIPAETVNWSKEGF